MTLENIFLLYTWNTYSSVINLTKFWIWLFYALLDISLFIGWLGHLKTSDLITECVEVENLCVCICGHYKSPWELTAQEPFSPWLNATQHLPAAHSQTKESQIPSFQWQPYPWALITQQWEGLEPLLGPLESILHLWTKTGCTQVFSQEKVKYIKKSFTRMSRTYLSRAV